ncbi:MAG: 50S ribosomal protein L15 [Candidatus Poribacteria bacterium]|nr:MAG: 50S ribosomal protein L15 [Candidatus Poribacteria bacterium]
MQLHELKPPAGAKKKPKRVGRGESSGHGKTAGRGTKGQLSRSGAKRRAWFEGGQMPLYRRLPKRGFKPPRRVEYALVNLSVLEERFEDGAVVTPEELVAVRAVRSLNRPVKVLGDGELSKRLTVRAHKFSRSAVEKIRALGGEVEVIE